jgi:hypothetical protein
MLCEPTKLRRCSKKCKINKKLAILWAQKRNKSKYYEKNDMKDSIKEHELSQLWRHTPVITALRELRQEH